MKTYKFLNQFTMQEHNIKPLKGNAKKLRDKILKNNTNGNGRKDYRSTFLDYRSTFLANKV